ncbi:MAG: amidohydrolase [Bacteroidota bacterium]
MSDLKVTLIQSDLHWRSISANLAAFEEKIWQIQEQQDLIVLPEMFTTGFTMEPEGVSEPVNGNTYKWLRQMAKQTKATVMGSAIIKTDHKYYNRLMVARPGEEIIHYDKKHLFTLAGEGGSFTAGEDRLIFEVKGWRIMPLICYDLRFPVWARSQGTSEQPYEYDLLVYVANWPTPRVQAWDTLLRARAIENLCYSIGVNRIGVDGYDKGYSGHSAAYDYVGDTVSYLGEEPGMSDVSLSMDQLLKFRERFPFQLDRDAFQLL